MAARLRKTFHSPSADAADDDNDDTNSSAADEEYLDEERQAALIARLRRQDAARNAQYRRAFLLVPGLAAPLYLTLLLRGPATACARTLALASLTACAIAGWVLRRGGGASDGRAADRGRGAPRRPFEDGVVPLQTALVGVLAVAGLVSWSQGRGGEAAIRCLPALVWGLVCYVRHATRPVDLTGLEAARYELKGA